MLDRDHHLKIQQRHLSVLLAPGSNWSSDPSTSRKRSSQRGTGAISGRADTATTGHVTGYGQLAGATNFRGPNCAQRNASVNDLVQSPASHSERNALCRLVGLHHRTRTAPPGSGDLTKYGHRATRNASGATMVRWPGSALTCLQYRANNGRLTKVICAGTRPRRSVGLGCAPVTVGQLGSEIRPPTTRVAPSNNRLS